MRAVQIVGAGGIGCAVGYALAAAGRTVTFVETNAQKIADGRRFGVRVDGLPPLATEFIPFANWVPVPGTPVLLCTKCYDNPAVFAKLRAGITLIPIQNGFDPLLVNHDHQFEGIASFVSECDPNRPHTRITRPGDLHLGQANSSSTGIHLDFPTTPLFRVRHVQRIAPIKHAKLMYNAAISPLAAAAGIDNGELLSLPTARKLFFALLQENYRILSAAGCELGQVGPFHPRTVAWILRRKWLAGLMARGFEPSLRGTYCSMAGEIQKGRTEIDNYNGHLIRLAEQHGLPCPRNRAVVRLLNQMTAERAEPHRGVLEALDREPVSLTTRSEAVPARPASLHP